MAARVIYLDANATTPPAPGLFQHMTEVAELCYGNPGSNHQLGRAARQVLEQARRDVATILDGSHKELIFTSGATESTNLALFGLAEGAPAHRRKLVTTKGEHPATREVVARLARSGWEVEYLPVDYSGRIRPEAYEKIDWPSVGLAAVLLANNETGVIQDLAPLRNKCEEYEVPWHVDVVQAVGRIPVSIQQLGATATTFGVHKCHGPRGIGGFFLKLGTPFVSTLLGGFQERGYRPGTEPVVLAAGMAWGLQEWSQNEQAIRTGLQEGRDLFEALLQEKIPDVVINGRESERLPNTSSVLFPGIDAEALLVSLDLEGVCCSLGSACASGSAEASVVLLAMGISPSAAKSAVRFSLHRYLSLEDIREAVARIARVTERLRVSKAH